MFEVESQAQTPDVWAGGGRPDVVLCPIGGGGLISGISLGSKGIYGKEVVVVGVEPSGKPGRFILVGSRHRSISLCPCP